MGSRVERRGFGEDDPKFRPKNGPEVDAKCDCHCDVAFDGGVGNEGNADVNCGSDAADSLGISDSYLLRIPFV